MDAPLTVGELTRRIKDSLESDFRGLWVEGEVSGCKAHTSGHIYLTLKDADARLDAVIWRSTARGLRVRPVPGMQVLVFGRLSVYPPRGGYQLIIERLQEAGAGALEAALARLKARLAEEGLFDATRKRPLPRLPRRVGVVTSPTSAARRDIEAVLHRRSPQIPILLYPAQVQGEGAAVDVARGVHALGAAGVDVVIVSRGGGSIEDLWAFNEEVVARAIATCPAPVISGVGHETDVTIADLVADHRAATPSAAAEAAVPVRDDLMAGVDALETRMTRTVSVRFARSREAVDHLRHRLLAGLRFGERRARLAELRARLGEQHPAARISRARHAVDRHRARLSAYGPARTAAARTELKVLAAHLAALSPLANLDRGYSLTRRADGHVVRSHEDVEIETELVTLLRDGWLRARVTAAGPGQPNRADHTPPGRIEPMREED